MTKIFLTTEIPTEKTAASKARVDVLDILQTNGYQTLYLPRNLNVANTLRFWKELSAMAKGETHVVIEYPCWMKRRMYVVYALCKLKGIRLYGIIHDIGALRFQTSPKPDMAILRMFDGLVSHNPSMSEWLRGNGFRKKIADLFAFDYRLTNERSFNQPGLNGTVSIFYAGNLNYKKATYIYDERLNELNNVQLNVYGQEFDKEKITGTTVNYKGLFNPGDPNLPEHYHFGLIWEGESVDTCNGQLGDYIRYNNPHKFSLYLSLGLPVIVWKEAAIASFVLANNLGFTISSLRELQNLGGMLTEEKYAEYLHNASAMAGKVRRGHFLTSALASLTKS